MLSSVFNVSFLEKIVNRSKIDLKFEGEEVEIKLKKKNLNDPTLIRQILRTTVELRYILLKY